MGKVRGIKFGTTTIHTGDRNKILTMVDQALDGEYENAIMAFEEDGWVKFTYSPTKDQVEEIMS